MQGGPLNVFINNDACYSFRTRSLHWDHHGPLLSKCKHTWHFSLCPYSQLRRDPDTWGLGKIPRVCGSHTFSSRILSHCPFRPLPPPPPRARTPWPERQQLRAKSIFNRNTRKMLFLVARKRQTEWGPSLQSSQTQACEEGRCERSRIRWEEHSCFPRGKVQGNVSFHVLKMKYGAVRIFKTRTSRVGHQKPHCHASYVHDCLNLFVQKPVTNCLVIHEVFVQGQRHHSLLSVL